MKPNQKVIYYRINGIWAVDVYSDVAKGFVSSLVYCTSRKLARSIVRLVKEGKIII